MTLHITRSEIFVKEFFVVSHLRCPSFLRTERHRKRYGNTAVQIRRKFLRLDLISLEFSISRRFFQNQVHHGDTESTEGVFL